MKWTESYIYTVKEKPADAEIPSHQLMLRAGLIRKLSPGIFTYSSFMSKGRSQARKYYS